VIGSASKEQGMNEMRGRKGGQKERSTTREEGA
jgi:hypothetical protein